MKERKKETEKERKKERKKEREKRRKKVLQCTSQNNVGRARIHACLAELCLISTIDEFQLDPSKTTGFYLISYPFFRTCGSAMKTLQLFQSCG